MKQQRGPKLPPLLRPGGDAEKRKKRSNHKLPKKQELAVADSVGGKRVRGSGSGEDKGDVARDGGAFPMKVECKRSMGKESISLKASHLTKISAEAAADGVFPALDIQFDREVMSRIARASGRPEASTDWIAVPLYVMTALLEAAEDE